MMSSVRYTCFTCTFEVLKSTKMMLLLFRWWVSTALTMSPNQSITSLTWTVHLQRAGVTTITRHTRIISTTCMLTWPSSTTCAGTKHHNENMNQFASHSESHDTFSEQEAGLPYLRSATSLRGGGAYSSPRIWIHAVRKHLTWTAAQEGTWTLGESEHSDSQKELVQKSHF